MDRRTIYLADTLSLLRAVSVLGVITFSLAGMWKTALVLLALGWATDLFDGLAARKYGCYRDTHPNFDADGLADSALAFGSSLVPIGYAIHHTGWLSAPSITLMIVFVATVALGGWMVAIMNNPVTPLNRWVIAINMIVMHGGVQIVAVMLWFTYMAFGYGFAFAVAVNALVAITVYQRDKVLLWWNGRFA
ncbi:MAG: CDP-alcohol phosphatidyltransferase family protein [Candidatus Saccharibacteria bacterium]|nr:MAG: CDP-alcohol phosphatidyltransferase family protein [Candidatus Saccharibacteria bacterium]